MAVEKILFLVNLYDNDGDVIDEGVYLEIGDALVKVCSIPSEFAAVMDNLQRIQKEINENYPTPDINSASQETERCVSGEGGGSDVW